MLDFNGSIRLHELLSREENSYDVTQTLLVQDVKILKTKLQGKPSNVVEILLKAPKEQKLAKGVNVELFPIPDSEFCPLKAYQKWNNLSTLRVDRGQVLFRKNSGKTYTGKQFNKDLKQLLSPHIDYDKGRVLAHSFRSGLATTIAQLGEGLKIKTAVVELCTN